MTIEERRNLFMEKVGPYLLDPDAIVQWKPATPAVIYFLFGEDSRWLYIGWTGDLGHRQVAHNREIQFARTLAMPVAMNLIGNIESVFIRFTRPDLNTPNPRPVPYEDEILAMFGLPAVDEEVLAALPNPSPMTGDVMRSLWYLLEQPERELLVVLAREGGEARQRDVRSTIVTKPPLHSRTRRIRTRAMQWFGQSSPVEVTGNNFNRLMRISSEVRTVVLEMHGKDEALRRAGQHVPGPTRQLLTFASPKPRPCPPNRAKRRRGRRSTPGAPGVHRADRKKD